MATQIPLISENKLFRTPESAEDLLEWVDQFDCYERTNVLIAAMLGFNLAASMQNKLVEEHRKEYRDAHTG